MLLTRILKRCITFCSLFILLIFWHSYCLAEDNAAPANANNAEKSPAPLTKKITDPKSVYSEINTLRLNKKLEQAKSLAIAYLKEHPGDADIMLLLGLIYYQNSEYDLAKIYLKKVLESSPTYLDAKLGLIRVAIAQKNFNEASRLIKEAVQQAPDNLEVKQLQIFYDKAVKAQESAEKIKQIEDKQEVNSVKNPALPAPAATDAKAVYSEISALRLNKKINQAKAMAKAYLQQHPTDVDMMLLLGLIYYQNSEYALAKIYFKKVLELSPTYLDAKLGLIRVEVAQKNFNEASRLIKEVVQQAPDNLEVKQIQIFYDKAVRGQEPTEKIKKEDKQEGNSVKNPALPVSAAVDAKAVYSKISALRLNKKIDQAKVLAKAYLQQHPTDLDMMLLLGLIYYQNSEYDLAKIYFKKVLKLSPTYLDAKLGLIRVEIAQKNFNEASTLIKEVVQQAPDNLEVKQIQSSYANAAKAQEPIVKQNYYKKIKALRDKHQLNAAKELALKYLKKNPNDADVMLLLGLIYYQQSYFSKAEVYFTRVLKKTPRYLDAKLGLIRVKMVQKKFKDAANLIKQAIQQDPKNLEVRKLQISYKKATNTNQGAKTQKINYKLLLINREIEKNNLTAALMMINKRLHWSPMDPDLLLAKAKILFKYHLYGKAGYLSRKVLDIDLNNKAAKEVLSNIKEINPHMLYGVNEIGIASINEYVSDLRANWDYSTIYYSRETSAGRFFTRVNYAYRFKTGAYQPELEFSPVLNQYLSLELRGNYGTNPVIFPRFTVNGEAYLDIPKVLNISFGELYAFIIKETSYKKYTGSVSKSFEKYWLSARANHYVPRIGPRSTLYMAEIRRYFNTYDFYVACRVGWGTSPDLSDLVTLDFLVIKNKFINLRFSIPIFNHRALMDLGVSYSNWKYPSGLIRKLYGASVGLNYRF